MTMTDHRLTTAEREGRQERTTAAFRASDGRGDSTPLLRLTTTDTRSGQPYTTSIPYARDYSRLVIVAEPVADTLPDWFSDLVANPNVTIELGNETFRATARVATGEERLRLLAAMTAQRASASESGRETPEHPPVIVLERVLDRDSDYNAFNRGFIEEFRARDGKVGGIFEGLPLLLLTTTGAKTGQPRIAPLLYGEDNGRLVIVASKGGSPSHPDWYVNLLANPDVTVDLGTESFPARARATAGPERERLFALLKGVIPMLEETQAKTPRQLPVVVLERVS